MQENNILFVTGAFILLMTLFGCSGEKILVPHIIEETKEFPYEIIDCERISLVSVDENNLTDVQLAKLLIAYDEENLSCVTTVKNIETYYTQK